MLFKKKEKEPELFNSRQLADEHVKQHRSMIELIQRTNNYIDMVQKEIEKINKNIEFLHKKLDKPQEKTVVQQPTQPIEEEPKPQLPTNRYSEIMNRLRS